jgi:polyhydroxyalkanoate synthesis regulator phasin
MMDMTQRVIKKELKMSEETSRQRVRASIYDATRTILLAAIGAASLAQDEISGIVDRLVERGEIAEGDARKLVHEMVERRDKLEHGRKERASKRAGTTSSQEEINVLTRRVADLTREIEELKKGKAN